MFWLRSFRRNHGGHSTQKIETNGVKWWSRCKISNTYVSYILSFSGGVFVMTKTLFTSHFFEHVLLVGVKETQTSTIFDVILIVAVTRNIFQEDKNHHCSNDVSHFEYVTHHQ